MSDDGGKLTGPDLIKGVALSDIADGAMLLGHADFESALLARRGDEVFAVGALCTHYGAPLEQGLLVEDSVRCQWHHACFSLRTGEALRAPALDPLSCWRVEKRDGVVYVLEKLAPTKAPPWRPRARRNRSSSSVVAERATRRPRCSDARVMPAG